MEKSNLIIDDKQSSKIELTTLQLLISLKALHNTSYQDLARKTGISKSYLQEIFSGKHEPSPKTKDIIAEAFGVSSLRLWNPQDYITKEEKHDRKTEL